MSYDARRWNARSRPIAHRRSWTRWLMLLGLALGLLFSVMETFMPDPDASGFPAPIGLLALVNAAASSPFMRESWFTARGRAMLDDFERDAMLLATTRAFAIFLVASVVFLAWMWVGGMLGWTTPGTPRAWGSWCLFALLAGVTLPATIAEFTVPPPPTEDA